MLQETANKFFDEAYDVHFLQHGQFLWSSWRDGTYAPLSVSLRCKQSDGRRCNAGAAIDAGDWEVLSVAGIDEKQGIVYYTSNETDVREEMLWQIGLDGAARVSTFHGVHHITLSPDATHTYVDSASSLTQPAGSQRVRHGQRLHTILEIASAEWIQDGRTGDVHGQSGRWNHVVWRGAVAARSAHRCGVCR